MIFYNPWGHDSPSSFVWGADDGIITLNWEEFFMNFDGYYTLEV